MSSPAPTAALRRTALYDTHLALGARMVPFAGWEMPVSYDGILTEHTRVRTHVGLFDVSHMGELRVTGPNAIAALNTVITNDLTKVSDGRAQYTALCAADGTLIDDLICYRLSPEDVFICVNASNLAAHLPSTVTLRDESEDFAQIAVQGPNAPELLRRVFGSLSKLAPFRIRPLPFADATVLFATTGYTGEPGAELYLPPDHAPALWAALMDAGSDLQVGPAGLGARDTLRLEMGYCLYGNDIDATTTPLEAGLAWVTRLEKPDFVGRSALVAQRDAGLPRTLVGLEVFERGIPRQGYPILDLAGAPLGHITSGTLSPSTNRAIALGYVPPASSALGTELLIDCRGKHRPARVVPTPFYTKPTA